MSDDEAVNRRLRAVERSLTDGDREVEALREAGDVVERVESLESQVGAAEDRIAELEAATQALRGYVGNVRSVNEDVEQRADAALATAERLEERLDGEGHDARGNRSPPVRRPGAARRQPRTGDPAARDDDPESDAERDDAGFLTRVRSVL